MSDSASMMSQSSFFEALDLPTTYPYDNSCIAGAAASGSCPAGPLSSSFHTPDGSIDYALLIEKIPEKVNQLGPLLYAVYKVALNILAPFIALFGPPLTSRMANPTYINAMKFLICISMSTLASDEMFHLEFNQFALNGVFLYFIFLAFVGLFMTMNTKGHSPILSRAIIILPLLSYYFSLDRIASYHNFSPEMTKADPFLYPHLHRTPGAFFNKGNELAAAIHKNWDPKTYTYDFDVATPWALTGDTRTLLPFILNNPERQSFERRWIDTGKGEAVAIDFTFPVLSSGEPPAHDSAKPLYVILHGLNGGSSEAYVQDLAKRRKEEGSTVAVIIARGLMDTPIRTEAMFNGARVDDVVVVMDHLRAKFGKEQKIVAVGFSMGAIVLANYVARAGEACPLDAAIAISGGINCEHNYRYIRSRYYWQPFLADTLRSNFFVRFHEQFVERLGTETMVNASMARSVLDIDELLIAPYNGFDDVRHYYREMSGAGVPGRILGAKIPLCIVFALDDPIVSASTLLNPNEIVESNPNVFFAITERGGHVGWPTGMSVTGDDWKWMSNSAKGFVDAVLKAKKEEEDERSTEGGRK